MACGTARAGRGARTHRAAHAVATSVAVLALATSSAGAQVWRAIPSIAVEETYTNNVDLSPNGARRSDLVSQITPSLAVTERGAHSSLNALISVPFVFRPRSDIQSSSIEPEVRVVGHLEAVPQFFFLDGSISVTQQYLSPFGQQSTSLANATNNRFTSTYYEISPYIKHNLPAEELSYELRDRISWTSGYGDQNLTSSSTVNELTGNITRRPTPFGWIAEISRTETRFTNRSNNLLEELARLRGTYAIDPQLEVEARAGYEHNDLGILNDTSNAIYGAGFKWRPSDRTKVDAFWEHRFFGSSYNVDFSNRTPLSVWSLVASRDITTYPQQLAALPAGIDVSSILNQLFVSKIPDPSERQTVVDQLIQNRGLPSVLSSPVTLYTENITLQERLIGTVGLLGARNAVFFSVFRQHNEPIVGPDNAFISDLLFALNNTQEGGSVTWSHTLAPLLTLTAGVDGSRTVATGSSRPGTTRQVTAHAMLSTQLSVRTTAFAGLRFQASRSNVVSDFDEAEVFAGFVHQFR